MRLLALGLLGGCSAHDAPIDAALEVGPPESYVARTVGAASPELPEVSGLVASRAHPGVLWAHNDSGHDPHLFAIDETGALLATLAIEGATNVDWEDIALAPGDEGDVLYLADVGDNHARDHEGPPRESVRLYRLPEPDPTLGDRSLAAETIELRYPDAAHDCESLLVHPATGDVYLVTKEAVSPARIMVARAPLVPGTSRTLADVGAVDLALATAADVRRDGSALALRSYQQLRVYELGGRTIEDVLASGDYRIAPATAAAEALAWDARDRDLFTVAEGAASRLYRVSPR